MKRVTGIVYLGARLAAAVILFQTLYFKFTAAQESVYIFTTVGMEPWGRIAVGIVELISAALLIISATAWIGAVMALGLMLGAIGMHLTVLGIEIQDDGGYLFILSVVVAACACYVLYCTRKTIKAFYMKLSH
jgi:uncharacterized membrane protein YphA (DoxX/SURF4 family)